MPSGLDHARGDLDGETPGKPRPFHPVARVGEEGPPGPGAHLRIASGRRRAHVAGGARTSFASLGTPGGESQADDAAAPRPRPVRASPASLLRATCKRGTSLDRWPSSFLLGAPQRSGRARPSGRVLFRSTGVTAAATSSRRPRSLVASAVSCTDGSPDRASPARRAGQRSRAVPAPRAMRASANRSSPRASGRPPAVRPRRGGPSARIPDRRAVLSRS